MHKLTPTRREVRNRIPSRIKDKMLESFLLIRRSCEDSKNESTHFVAQTVSEELDSVNRLISEERIKLEERIAQLDVLRYI